MFSAYYKVKIVFIKIIIINLILIFIKVSFASESFQIVSLSPESIIKNSNETFTMSALYDVSDGNNTLSGLGISLYFDSTILSLESYTICEGAIGEPLLITDTNDSLSGDNDVQTDKKFTMAWINFPDLSWPNKELPIVLCELTFSAKSVDNSYSTNINVCFNDNANNYKGKATNSLVTINNEIIYNLDIDKNGKASGASDGLLAIRYLFESRGETLVNGVIDLDNCNYCNIDEIEKYLENAKNFIFDIDGNGEALGATDGLLIIRYLFESRDESLISGVVDKNNCTRCDVSSIESYLQSICP